MLCFNVRSSFFHHPLQLYFLWWKDQGGKNAENSEFLQLEKIEGKWLNVTKMFSQWQRSQKPQTSLWYMIWVKPVGLVIALEEAHWFNFLSRFSHMSFYVVFFFSFSLLSFPLCNNLFSDPNQLKWTNKDGSGEKKNKRSFVKKMVTECRPFTVPVLMMLMVLMVFSSCLSNWSKSFSMPFLTLYPPLFFLVVIQIVPLKEQINACHEN